MCRLPERGRILLLAAYYSLVYFTAILVLSFIFLINVTKAASDIETIEDSLSELTCEGKGVGNLLREEFSHTCIPAPFFTFVGANAVSPGLYANTFLRVHINDEELFPGSCKRENRVSFSDQKLSFSMCNNIDLAKVRGSAIEDSAVVIAQSMLTGEDPWDDIKSTWDIQKSSYHRVFKDKKEGDEGVMLDVGIIPAFPWKIIREQDKICVATRGFGGWIPIGCKYIKEPFPVSIYADFMDSSPEGIKELENLTSLTTCGNMGSCYERAHENSRTAVVMSGPLIECVKEMIAKLMISSSVCSFEDIDLALTSSSRATSVLFQFQKNMHRIVSALLIIYVILFGFKIVLSGDVPNKASLVGFIVKFLFVIYFSIGINIGGGDGSIDKMDGMTQWAFPFLLGAMGQLSSWVMNAGPSDLCNFSDIIYPEGLQHMQLWDALDRKSVV